MNDTIIVDGKKCSGCEKFKNFSDFYKDTYHQSGYKSECKECNRKRKGAKKFIPVIKSDNGKECRTCGEFKSFADFHKDKRQSDGHVSKCKMCRNARMKQYYEENKEEVLQRNAHYVENNKEKVKTKWRMYREENREYLRLKSRKWWHENADVLKAKKRQWAKTEQGREAYYKARIKRRSHKYKLAFTPIERNRLLERDNWTCKSCGCKVHDMSTGNWNTPDKAHIDHIIPISKGGNSEPSNLQVLCRTCNLSKQDKILNTI